MKIIHTKQKANKILVNTILKTTMKSKGEKTRIGKKLLPKTLLIPF